MLEYGLNALNQQQYKRGLKSVFVTFFNVLFQDNFMQRGNGSRSRKHLIQSPESLCIEHVDNWTGTSSVFCNSDMKVAYFTCFVSITYIVH